MMHLLYYYSLNFNFSLHFQQFSNNSIKFISINIIFFFLFKKKEKMVININQPTIIELLKINKIKKKYFFLFFLINFFKLKIIYSIILNCEIDVLQSRTEKPQIMGYLN